MHDIHEANKILKLILEEAKKNNLKKIKKAVIELGQVIEHGQTISPENLKFNLKLLAKDTVAEKAEFVISESKNDFWKVVEIEGEEIGSL